MGASQSLNDTLSVLSIEATPRPWGQEAPPLDKLSMFRAIGAGTCGTVFEIPNTLEVVKRAKDGYKDALWNDYLCHKRVLERIGRNVKRGLQVPKSLSFVPADDQDFWPDLAAHFPTDYRSQSALSFSERIPPVPESVRFALIDRYFPEEARSEAKTSEGNKDCLIRIYLGKRRDPDRLKPSRVSLRNYNLHLDQMEELGLDTETFADTMARTLAVMHWDACIDADDVEFVLGSSRTSITHGAFNLCDLTGGEGPICTLEEVDIHTHGISMWVLDFDKCQRIRVHGGEWELPSAEAERTQGLEMAVAAFFRNDPYYPRPLSSNAHEQRLWRTFRDAYRKIGRLLLKDERPGVRELPDRFITMVEDQMEVRLANKLEAERRLAAMGPRGWEEPRIETRSGDPQETFY